MKGRDYLWRSTEWCTASTEPRFPVERYASLVTLIAGCVVMQVFADRGQPEQTLVMGPRSGPFHTALFPPNMSVISWPLESVLDDATLQGFVEALGPLTSTS